MTTTVAQVVPSQMEQDACAEMSLASNARQGQPVQVKEIRRYLPFAIIAVVLFASLGAGTLLFRSAWQGSLTPQAYFAASGANPAHIRGAATAPVTLEEFGDFQCPACSALHPTLKQIESDYGPRVRVIFRQYPLVPTHIYALEAARASEAAALQDRFWDMHDLLYENQPTWGAADDARPLFIDYARSLNLDIERFTRDMYSPVVNARIISDYKRGKKIGVTGTPTLFINGRELPGPNRTVDDMHAAIDAALGGKG